MATQVTHLRGAVREVTRAVSQVAQSGPAPAAPPLWAAEQEILGSNPMFDTFPLWAEKACVGASGSRQLPAAWHPRSFAALGGVGDLPRGVPVKNGAFHKGRDRDTGVSCSPWPLGPHGQGLG